jgi:hypothetical protein
LAKDSELQKWEEKRGGFYQHDTSQSLTCSFLDEKRVRLRHGSESIARTILSSLGVATTSLQLASMQLLRSSKGIGLQKIHFDIVQYALAIRCYTFLLYLTPTLSTAVPVTPLSELRSCFTEGEKRPSAAALDLLTPEKLYTTRVEAGDMLAFNCAVPHQALANPDAADRYVLFLLFSPNNSPTPDSEQQRYPQGVKD